MNIQRTQTQEPSYFDSAATTPVDPRVVQAMLPYFFERFGNPTRRIHSQGRAADRAVELARERIAALIGARAVEITFTSGATESNNLALAGVAEGWNNDCDVLVGASEHPSVLEMANHLARKGVRVTRVPVGRDGRIDLARLEVLLEEVSSHQSREQRRVLVSIMHVNNETGTIQPVAEIGALCARFGALYHCDASQSVGKLPVEVDHIGADLLSLSGHKFYAPKGVGALYVRRRRPRLPLCPQLIGGGQERGFRSGTLNVPGIVGLGAAAEVAAEQLDVERAELERLSQLIVACLSERLEGVRMNGSDEYRVPGILNLSFDGVSGEQLELAIRPVAEIATGSACATGKVGPSESFAALGLAPERAEGAVRISLGRFISERRVHLLMDAIVPAVERLRARHHRWKAVLSAVA